MIRNPFPSPPRISAPESDLYFGNVVKDGGFGKFHHNRELAPIDRQPVIRLNRDTLYSAAVFDLDAGPVTVSLPDAGKRFMSLQVIDEDQYCPAVLYGAGSTRSPGNRSGRGTSSLRFARSSIPRIRRTLKRSTSYKMRSGS